jgi:hypothetical protein
MAGLPASGVPYYQHANYVDENGQPLVSIPDPGPQAGDYEVPALNSPQGMARMRLREMGGRAPSSRALGLPDPEDTPELPTAFPPTANPITGEPASVGNIVHLDDAFAHLDGQFIPLDDMDLSRIGGIVVRALERKMKLDYRRLKDAYMQPLSRKQKAMHKPRKARRKAVSAPPAVAPGESTESA